MTTEIISIRSPSASNPLNPLSKDTRKHLKSCITKALSDRNVNSIILFGGSNFSAGADISEFSAKNNPESSISSTEDIPSLTELCALIESSPKPIIAAITGVALGGGLELALACHFRIAHCKSKLALPETKIGLIPGAGGTQRLPRLCPQNLQFVLNLIVSGRTISAEEAKRMNVVDHIVDSNDVLESAKKWATFAQLLNKNDLNQRRTCNKEISQKQVTHIFQSYLKKLPSSDRGGRALHAAVKAIQAACTSATFEEGMEVESELFWDLLLNSQQGRALRYAFFAERIAGRKTKTKLTSSVAQSLLNPTENDVYVGIIGAGTMGSGIAISFLRAGYKVILVDNSKEGLGRGFKLITKVIEQDVKKNRIHPDQASNILKHNLLTTTDIKSKSTPFENCLIVVEAVFENLSVKKSIFSQLDEVIKNPQALLLSNTSTLNIDSITSMVSPERRQYCAGMHFFSPAHVMKLVEIVISSHTSAETANLINSITTKKLKKVGVTVGNCEGFVGNRMLFPYTGESVFVLQEGRASVAEVDRAIVKFGMAIGPLTMGDLAGNDIGYFVRKEKGLAKDTKTGLPGSNREKGMRYTDLGDDLVTQLGRVGQKKLKGWYDYDIKVGRGRTPIESKEVSDFIANYREGTVVQKYTEKEIVERVLFPLVNEGFKILEEGFASSPSDIDIIYLYGYGWPAWRGGPMFWADSEVGLSYLLGRLEEMNSQFPGSTYYVPSNLLRSCVAQDITVQEYYERGLHKKQSSSKL